MLLKFLMILFLSVIVALPGGCSTEEGREGAQHSREEENISIITTIFPLADIINNIGGERVQVITLMSPGDSPHTFEPSVEQARKTSRANLMFYIGGGLDDWAVGLARGEGVPTVEVMDYMDQWILDYQPIHLEEGHEGHSQHQEDHHHHHHDGEHCHNDCCADDHDHHDCSHGGQDHESHDCGHYHGPHDPHVWMNPVLVKEIIAPLVYDQLKSVSPDDEVYFQENLLSFQEELEELNQDIEEKVKGFSRRRFISYHSAWNYFAQQYGLEESAAIEVFPGREPSARWLAELVDLAEEKDIQIIFAEPQLSSKAAETIAGEIGGKVKILDPLGGEGVSNRESYIALIRYNLEIFREALE